MLKKRLMSILLAAALLITCLPVFSATAFAGDEPQAESINESFDFGLVNGGQLRLTGTPGIRYIAGISKGAIEYFDGLKADGTIQNYSYGFIYAPSHYIAGGRVIISAGNTVANLNTADLFIGATITNPFTNKQTTPAKVTSGRLLCETDDTAFFSLVLKGFGGAQYQQYFTVRPYFEYTDSLGAVHYIYAGNTNLSGIDCIETVSRSYYSIAKAQVERKPELAANDVVKNVFATVGINLEIKEGQLVEKESPYFVMQDTTNPNNSFYSVSTDTDGNCVIGVAPGVAELCTADIPITVNTIPITSTTQANAVEDGGSVVVVPEELCYADVSFNADGAVNTVTVPVGDTVEAPASPEKTNFSFLGWYEKDEAGAYNANTFDFTSALTADKVLYAKFSRTACSVTVNYNNPYACTNEAAQVKSFNIAVGATVGVEATPKYYGHIFGGWYTTSDFQTGTEFNVTSAVNDDINLYAKWTAIPSITGAGLKGKLNNVVTQYSATVNKSGAFYITLDKDLYLDDNSLSFTFDQPVKFVKSSSYADGDFFVKSASTKTATLSFEGEITGYSLSSYCSFGLASASAYSNAWAGSGSTSYIEYPVSTLKTLFRKVAGTKQIMAGAVVNEAGIGSQEYTMTCYDTACDYLVCFTPADATEKCSVTYSVLGENRYVYSIPKDSYAIDPRMDTVKGYYYYGWYKDADLTQPWDFATDVVTENMTLYCSLEEDGTINFGSWDYANYNEFYIDSVEDYEIFAALVNSNGYNFAGKTVYMSEDVDLAGTSYLPIGGNGTNVVFKGTFDGQNHTISNLVLTGTADAVGLFGDVNGTIKNLTVNNISITAVSSNGTGGIVGKLAGTVSNCHITGTIAIKGKAYTGGICGTTGGTKTIERCSVIASSGYSETTSPASSSNAHINGAGNQVGGIIGQGGTTTYIKNCCVRAYVYAASYWGGGICGIYPTSAEVADANKITNCYIIGCTQKPSFIIKAYGPIVGNTASGTSGATAAPNTNYVALNCFYFWNNGSSDSNYSAGKKTLANLKTVSTFSDAGWDISADGNTIWHCSGSGYPTINKGYTPA